MYSGLSGSAGVSLNRHFAKTSADPDSPLYIPPLFIRERLMAFAFLARNNYDSSRQLKITRVTNKFIDKERGSESFDTNPSSLALLLTVVPLVYARALSK